MKIIDNQVKEVKLLLHKAFNTVAWLIIDLNLLTLVIVTLIPHVMELLVDRDTGFENGEQGGNELVVETYSGC